jgi:3-methylcrotonyl-CoA carboxylase alpha subunit
MEMNTRLQVEHPVTEMVTDLDLVELQLRIASGEPLPLCQDDVALNGHAVEARLYAEDPARDFQPQTGIITRMSFPQSPDLRIDSGVRAGDAVQHYYDPLLAKLIVHAPTRAEAVSRLARTLAHGEVAGCRSNLDFLNRLLRHPAVAAGDVETGLIARNLDALLSIPEPPIEAIATALLFACGFLSPPRSCSPFDTLTGFRLWGGETYTHTFMVGHKSLACRLESGGGRFIACEADRSLGFRLLSRDEATLRLDCGDRIAEFSYFHHEGALTIVSGEARYEFGLGNEVSASSASDGGGLVISPMPGLLRSILVAVGDCVEPGTVVAMVEAMKMELSLKAERGGKVMEVNARQGEQIVEGAVLFRIGDSDG